MALEDRLEVADPELVGLERPRRQVDAEIHVPVRHPGAGRDGLQAGEVELDGPIGRLGGAEQRAGIGEQRAAGRPDERLEADRAARRHREDRLVDGPQRARREDGADAPRTAPPPSGRPRPGRAARSRTRRRPSGRGACTSRAPRRRCGTGPGSRCSAPGYAETPIETENGSIGVLGSPPLTADARIRRPTARPVSTSETGQQDRELVAADAERAVAPPEHGRGHPAHGLEQPVAVGVAVRVVDDLEVVDVDQQQRQRQVHPLGHLELAGQLVLERAVVAEPGQPVDQRVVARPAVQPLQLVAFALECVDLREIASEDRSSRGQGHDQQRTRLEAERQVPPPSPGHRPPTVAATTRIATRSRGRARSAAGCHRVADRRRRRRHGGSHGWPD